jgi:hypothetical protein
MYKTHAFKRYTDDTGYTWGHTLCGIESEGMSEDFQENGSFVDYYEIDRITCLKCFKKAHARIIHDSIMQNSMENPVI